ncbi:hypothetical protein [Nocardioides lijunqiniae]|uniref:hypothetical protein n=1 Tax=Nocardioides lijunqiniae TaxID=2760832 RepID=UPI001877D614|nr:hypothetical protein [Nocardioides lijunqiniae]
MSSWVRVLQGRRRVGPAAHGTRAGGQSTTPVNSSPVAGNSYVDAGLGGVTSYYFMVRAIAAADISR